MKSTLTLVMFLFLSGCATLETQTTKFKTPQSVPSVWQSSGRLSATIDGVLQSAGFDIRQQNNNYQLLLTGNLSLGQIKFEFDHQQLLVNNQVVNKNLKQWMLSETGWYFPIEIFADVLFKSRTGRVDDWLINIGRYQSINKVSYPKIVHLKHQSKPIKIKLSIVKVNQLK